MTLLRCKSIWVLVKVDTIYVSNKRIIEDLQLTPVSETMMKRTIGVRETETTSFLESSWITFAASSIADQQISPDSWNKETLDYVKQNLMISSTRNRKLANGNVGGKEDIGIRYLSKYLPYSLK